MKLSLFTFLIVTTFSLVSCKREDKQDIIHDELKFVAIDKTDNKPIPNLPITILEFETPVSSWGWTYQKEIFVGTTDANGKVNLNYPIKRGYRYRFWKKHYDRSSTDTLSVDWSYFTKEYFIEGDTFPKNVVMKLKPTGQMLIAINDTTLINSGYDSVVVSHNGFTHTFDKNNHRNFYNYRKPNISYPFLISNYKDGVLSKQYTEDIYFKNSYTKIGPDGYHIYRIYPK